MYAPTYVGTVQSLLVKRDPLYSSGELRISQIRPVSVSYPLTTAKTWKNKATLLSCSVVCEWASPPSWTRHDELAASMNIKAVDSSSSDTKFTVHSWTIELNEMSRTDNTIELNEMASHVISIQTNLCLELPKDDDIDNHWLVPRKVVHLSGSSFIELQQNKK